MPFLTALGNKVSVTELQMYQKVSSLEGQGTIGGGPEDTFGDEEALHSVWKKTKGV